MFWDVRRLGTMVCNRLCRAALTFRIPRDEDGIATSTRTSATRKARGSFCRLAGPLSVV